MGMQFSSKQLRVQIPCNDGRSVVQDDKQHLELQARQYWRNVTLAYATDLVGMPIETTDCTRTDCGDSKPKIGLSTYDIAVLPIIRQQLEERLAEVQAIQASVEKMQR
jgi:hypothetical protein